VNSMYRRAAVISLKLESYGINPQAATREMLRRISGDSNPAPLQVLAAVVQPFGGHAGTGPHADNAFTPLNRLVDVVPPHSTVARQFNRIAARIAAGKATPQDWARARRWLVLWRDNDARLQPSLKQSQLTANLAPLSQTLSQVAAMGLDALSNLHDSRSVEPAKRQKNLEFLKAAEKPQADVLLMVAPSVELLVNATNPASGAGIWRRTR